VASRASALPMTVKIRVGHYEDEPRRHAHKLIPGKTKNKNKKTKNHLKNTPCPQTHSRWEKNQ